MLHFFRIPGGQSEHKILQVTQGKIPSIVSVQTESCFNVEVINGSLSEADRDKLLWLFTETFEPENTKDHSYFALSEAAKTYSAIVEVGPRLAFSTAWSSNCASMCQACRIAGVGRIERSRRYLIATSGPSVPLTKEAVTAFAALVHDRMTECVFTEPLLSFANGVQAAPVTVVPVLTEGKAALERLNKEKGLGFDDWDLNFYTEMFTTQLQRNPTDVECFDMGQSNSEHSRHWFFGGQMIIDGETKADTLFGMVKSTLTKGPESNSIIAFHDNSSSLRGFDHVSRLGPEICGAPCRMVLRDLTLHPILTAETHNFPTGVAPFAGAETGTGGRLRDVQATGRGAHTVAGISAYCVGQLHLPGHELPWEDPHWAYAPNLAHPLDILVEASNGASDYGNKYGEPVVCGFARSFGQRLPCGDRVEWVKPVMFTAGVGWLDGRHTAKGTPESGMVVCKIGGPAYRIGMGGGAASSRSTGTTEADALLDFDAVQRGDAEMENRMNRVIRACIEMGDSNPIVSIHDQGAGGNGNVLKEIVDPHGARYELRKIPVGDPTLSAMEIWGAEYQENCAFLVAPENLATVLGLAKREHCPVTPVGAVTGDGRVVLVDSAADANGSHPTPFDLPLSLVLGKMPQKVYHFTTPPRVLTPLVLPPTVTTGATSSPGDGVSGSSGGSSPLSVRSVLGRVLRLVDVGSKRFLTNKVDRSVTGLIAQQQCVGPLHTPLADVAVVASSHFGTTGLATAVGEQPIKGLLDSGAQARMTAGEALTNLMWAKVTSISDIKASGNWMWAAKLEGEGAKMWQACEALRDALLVLGPGIDGGKDSLSMAAQVQGETVKSPGELTLTLYASCPDITLTVTPDLKHPDEGRLLYVDLGHGRCRTGGTALSTVFGQLGDAPPDCQGEDLLTLRRCFDCVQGLLTARLVTAGHDRSDGGLLVTLLEMAFAGNCGLDIRLPALSSSGSGNSGSSSGGVSEGDDAAGVRGLVDLLFSEELGLVLEVLPANEEQVLRAFAAARVLCVSIGRTGRRHGAPSPPPPGRSHSVGDAGAAGEVARVTVRVGEVVVLLDESLPELRDVWESTSFALEARQCDRACVEQERASLLTRPGPAYRLTFDDFAPASATSSSSHSSLSPSAEADSKGSRQRHRVAVVRQEGSNGDREMLAAFHAAGLEAWDVNMYDLLNGRITLETFRGVVFCGGFSYADVNDSAKGWAGSIRFNESLMAQFSAFRDRPDTFSLGICNGCQLMALLGWVPFPQRVSEGALPPALQPRFVHNASGRFESRWSTVQIQGGSPAEQVLLKDMAGSSLGVWVAHGEGRALFPDSEDLKRAVAQGLAPVRYVDDFNAPTEAYPMNPNGSPLGIAGLCSEDGRHLAMMPHPERCVRTWQWPHLPAEWRERYGTEERQYAAPWLKLFQNAKDFCDRTEDLD